MTSRTLEQFDFRWKITLTHGDQFFNGSGWGTLMGRCHDCYRRGVCFKVELKELVSGDQSTDAAVGLTDRVLDEEST